LNRLPFTVVDPGSMLTDDQIPSDVLGFFELFFTNDLIDVYQKTWTASNLVL